MLSSKGTLNVSALLRNVSREKLHDDLYLNFSDYDFNGYTVSEDVHFIYTVAALANKIRLQIEIVAQLCGICARCLSTCYVPLNIKKQLDICLEELIGEYPEYPTVKDGILNLKELVYGEILIEAPIIFVCSENCAGLCGVCGKKKETCGCIAGEAANDTQKDARWAPLLALLNDDEK